MRRWIVWVGGAAVLGTAAWYFGKPTPAPVNTVATPQAAVVVEAPKVPPPKVIEVIDLARAYEPVREPEEVFPGGVDPATFIVVPSAPARIPYAASDETHLFRDLFRAIRRTPLGAVLFGQGGPKPERMEVMPRMIIDWSVYGYGTAGSFRISNVQIEGRIVPVVEKLDVMPREVDGPTQDLLHFLVEFGWM